MKLLILLVFAFLCLIQLGGLAEHHHHHHEDGKEHHHHHEDKKDGGHHHHDDGKEHHHRHGDKKNDGHHHHDDKGHHHHEGSKEHHHHDDKKDGGHHHSDHGKEHHHHDDKDGHHHHPHHDGKDGHHHHHEKECKHQLLPGISKMTQGVDITILELYPGDIAVSSEYGYCSEVFEFTCSKGKKFKHPNIKDYKYHLPDQVAHVETISAGQLDSDTSFKSDMSSVKKSMGGSVGLGLRVGHFGAFSGSASYQQAQEDILKSSKTMAETSAYVSSLKVALKDSSDMHLSHGFKKSIDKLPKHYKDDPEAYDNFVKKYGTHYFQRASFGGHIYLRTVISNSYMHSSSQKEIEGQLKAKILIVKAKLSGKSSSQTENEHSSSEMENHFRYYGGRANLAKEDSLKEWFDTVATDPWLFAGKLEPIESLIHSGHRKKGVKLATYVRRGKAYLADIKKSLELSKVELPEQDKKDLVAIEELLKNPASANVAAIEGVAKNIDAMFDRLQEIRNKAA